MKGMRATEGPNIPHLSKTCRLLQLPRELRDEIYTWLFASTQLAFSERLTGIIGKSTIKPNRNTLAILRTCRQISQEAGRLWLGQVLFSFESLKHLLDKFSPLPSSTLSEIRHVCTDGKPLVLTPIHYDDDVYYRAVWALKLLPSLHLDRLTILGSSYAPVDYDTLEGLIKHGMGWKELHFIAPNSSMLSFARINMFMAHPYWRKPQPSSWNEILLQRDGVNSGANIVIYRSTQADSTSSVTNPLTRQIFEQTTEDLETFGVAADEALSTEDEEKKELLFVVKRGRGVDITERDRPPFELDDIRQWSRGMTWAKIRRKCIDFLDESSEEDYLFDEEDHLSDEEDSLSDEEEGIVI